MADQDKGKFSANIGQDVIEEALRSVERRTPGSAPAATAEPPSGSEGAVSLDVEGGGAGEATAEGAAEAAAAEETPEQKELAALKEQLEFSQAKGRELMEKLKAEHERVLRATADLENYRKRAMKEKEEVQRFGVEKMLKDFLPVGDNFDRALEHAKTASDFDSLVTGIKMTRKLFDDALGKHGVRGFSATGKPFDPRMHEAMQQVETSELPPNTVYQEVLRGYTLHDRLMRPALVMVTKAPEAGAGKAGTEGGAGAAGDAPASSEGSGSGGGDGGAP